MLHDWLTMQSWRERERELERQLRYPAPAPLHDRLLRLARRWATAGAMQRDASAAVSRHTGGRC
ncbi:MAG TPA: hypothetical protein VKF59_16505 [Candidatus Dormibacteraeota bacterium]|nr:hypothetical protein [Candidatus Dormibacteraeota bacterium]